VNTARTVLNVAEVWCAAAFIMLLAMGLLYVALGLYGECITRLVKYIGATGALMAWARTKEVRDKWWKRWVDFDIRRWLDR
jgi:hypothetical protein